MPTKDSGAKVIFGDKTLCSEFLREYVKLPYCEDIQPEDISIVYYEGKQNWTVPRSFRDRIVHGNGISFVMMLNKLQSEADISNFLRLPKAQVGEIIEKLPWNQRDIIGDVLMAALMKMNMPMDEVEDLVGKVKDKKMSELFASMEKMDIQLERKKTADAVKRAEDAVKRAEDAEKKIKEMEGQIFESNIISIIELYQDFGLSEELAVHKIIDKYNLSMGDAKRKVQRYWKA